MPTDKTQLISASADGTIRQWNLANNQSIREIKHGAAITALAVRGDGKQIASAGADNVIKLWNAADGQPWASPDKQPIAAMKGDFRAQFRVAHLERALAAVTAKVADDKKAVADAEAKIIATAGAVTTSQTAKEAAAKTLAEKTGRRQSTDRCQGRRRQGTGRGAGGRQADRRESRAGQGGRRRKTPRTPTWPRPTTKPPRRPPKPTRK